MKFTMKIKTLALGVLIASSTANAGSVAGFGGSTEITQLLNNYELIEVAVDQAEELKYAIEQYRMLEKQYKTLPDHVKQNAIDDLKKLAGIVAQGRAVSYSSGRIDEEYQREHRDFEHYKNQQERNRENLSDRYRDWSQTNHDSVRGALNAAGLQASQFDREDSALKQIERQMETAEGTNQILQAGGAIAAMQVEQSQKLRSLMMAQIQLQTAQVGGQIDRQAQDDATWFNATENTNKSDPNRQEKLKFNSPFK